MNVIPASVAAGAMLLSIGVGIHAWGLKYFDALGPGPGFFPLWTAGALGVLGLAQAVSAVRGSAASDVGDDVQFDRSGAVRVSATVLLLLFAVLGMEPVGYEITMTAFTALMLVLLGMRGRLAGLALILVMGVGSGFVFRKLLGIPLPLGVFGS